MTKKEIKLVDTLQGKGKVFDGKDELSKVKYKLEIYQEYIIMRSNNGVNRTPTYKQIRGFVHVIEGERNLTGGNNLILQLKDNRRIEFFAKSGNPVSKSYEIVVSGGFEDPKD
jgi:hypothetical protein